MNKLTSKNYTNKFDTEGDYWKLYFDRWVACWEFYENKAGLTTRIIEALYEKICSPVLVLGSGQGLISEYLLLRGQDVTSSPPRQLCRVRQLGISAPSSSVRLWFESAN